MNLAGRVALVTAGSKGIGRAIALRLAADGADVAISYAHDDAAAAESVAAIERLGRRALAMRSGRDRCRRASPTRRWLPA